MFLSGNSTPSDFSGNAYGRLSFGLVSGVMENSHLEKARVIADTVFAGSISTSKKVSFNLGSWDVEKFSNIFVYF